VLFHILTMGLCDIHKTGNPVLWIKTHEPVITSFYAAKVRMHLISPCSLLPTENLVSRIANIMVKQCEKAYMELYLNNLKKICSKQPAQKTGKKRFIFIAGFILIAVIASAGVGMAGYAISQNVKLETKQEEMKVALDGLERELFIETEQSQVLRKEMRNITMNIDKMIDEFHLFREEVVETQFVISYLTGKLLDGKKMLQMTGKTWKKFEFTEDFFEYNSFHRFTVKTSAL